MSYDTDAKHHGMTRRSFIASLAAAGAAASLGGCGNNIEDRQIERASTADMIDALKATNAVYVDTEGKPVNLSGLKAKLSGSPSTMSFMFAACGDVCPTTASVLHSVSKARTDLRHVIVSLSPIDDFTGKKLESIVNAQGLKTSGAHANTIILYPTSDGSTTPRALIEGNKAGFDVQHKLELWTQGRDVSGHSGVITLFDANGKQLVQAMNNRDSTPMVKTLTQALAAQPTASR